jgi:hypothetical protein
MTTTLSKRDGQNVLAVTKTAVTEDATSAMLCGNMTLAESVAELARAAPRNERERRVKEQLLRELSGPHDFLVVSQRGELTKADPKTTLSKVAVPREIKTADGWEEIPVAAFEVQAYADVGSGHVAKTKQACSPEFERLRLATIHRIDHRVDCPRVICNRDEANRAIWKELTARQMLAPC